ncbi:MAG: serine/threonine protein kinase [Planctomycetaceae bacterium]|nr:serine/threonine protein kinase [Planctomycetaceae bacterium]
MTAKPKTVQDDERESLADPIDGLLVAFYRSLTPNRSDDSTHASACDACQDTPPIGAPDETVSADIVPLRELYFALISGPGSKNVSGFQLRSRLGAGGQGVVYLAESAGVDGFVNRDLALKLFSPCHYPTLASYETDMRRIAEVASIIAGSNQGNLLDIQRFEVCSGIRMMIMTRIQGHDLRRLMNPEMLYRLKHIDPPLFTDLTRVVAAPGQEHTKFTPGAAVAIIRSCLEALDRLHSRGVVHGDVKPSNIMLTPEGDVKVVDSGSAFLWRQSQEPYFCTPRYAALEVLEKGACTPRSDLASLGYVLVELLTGRPLFPDRRPPAPRETSMPQEASTGIKPELDRQLAEEKRQLPNSLDQLLAGYSLRLRQLCQRLIHPNPECRFESARAAELFAYEFVQELERAKLACHFHNEFRRWLEALQQSENHAG